MCVHPLLIILLASSDALDVKMGYSELDAAFDEYSHAEMELSLARSDVRAAEELGDAELVALANLAEQVTQEWRNETLQYLTVLVPKVTGSDVWHIESQYENGELIGGFRLVIGTPVSDNGPRLENLTPTHLAIWFLLSTFIWHLSQERLRIPVSAMLSLRPWL